MLVLRGFVPALGTTQDAVVVGSRAFLASTESGLVVVDITTPSNPTLIGASNLPFPGLALAVVGTRAVVVGATGLTVLDVTLPTTPRIVSQVPLLGALAVGLTPDGRTAVVVTGSTGLTTVDLTTPAAPVVVGTLDTPGFAEHVVVDGAVAYVADRTGGLRVVSLATPAAPLALGSVAPAGRSYRDVAVLGAVAYCVNQTGSFDVIDLTVLSAPRLATWVTLGASAFRVTASGSRALVTTATSTLNAISVLDLTTPLAPVLLASAQPIGPVGQLKGLALAGSTATLALSTAGVSTYTVTSTIIRVGTTIDTFAASSVAVAGPIALVVGKDLPTATVRFRVIDVSLPDTPRRIGDLLTSIVYPTTPPAVALVGSLGVAVVGSGGLWTIDLSTPFSPVLRGFLDTPGVAEHVVLNPSGTLAYVADGSGGLRVISVATPATPILVGSLTPTSRNYRDVALVGSLAYVINQTGSFDVIDVSTPATPVLVTWATLGASAFQLAVSGSRAVVYVIPPANTSDALVAVDLTDPLHPIVGATTPLGPIGRVRDLALDGARTYVASDLDGVLLIDPPQRVLVVGAARGVVLTPGLLYAADSLATLDVVAR